jgi:hypothetical protein
MPAQMFEPLEGRQLFSASLAIATDTALARPVLPPGPATIVDAGPCVAPRAGRVICAASVPHSWLGTSPRCLRPVPFGLK